MNTRGLADRVAAPPYVSLAELIADMGFIREQAPLRRPQ